MKISPSSSRPWSHAAVIVTIALGIRLPFAPYDYHTTADMSLFRGWVETLRDQGLQGAYESGSRINYPPVSLYVLSAAGWLHQHVGVPALRFVPARSGQATPDREEALLNALIKLSAMLADTATALLIWTVWRARAAPYALAAGLAYACNPSIWYVSAHWGQVDSIYTFLAVAAIILLERGRVGAASSIFVLALMSKLQAAAVAPILVVKSLRHPRTFAVSAAAGIATAAAVTAPWWLWGRFSELVAMVARVPPNAPSVVVSGFNLWYLALVGNVHQVSSTLHPWGLPFSYQFAGIVLFCAYAALIAHLARKHEHLSLPAAALSLGLFVLPTEVHERYMFPVLAFLALAATRHHRLWGMYGLLSTTFLLNLVTIAPFSSWFGINLVATADASWKTVMLKGLALITAAMNVGALVWLTLRIRDEHRGAKDLGSGRESHGPLVRGTT